MMKRRILALLLSGAMLLPLAACGNSDSGNTSTPPADNNSPSASQPAGEDTQATKTDTLKIGLLVHQTGWFAGVDTPNFNEFNAMIDYVNYYCTFCSMRYSDARDWIRSAVVFSSMAPSRYAAISSSIICSMGSVG